MLLSSKDKSCLWHIQPAFTQGLKSYIDSTKMFKLALTAFFFWEIDSSFCAARESFSFPEFQVHMHVFAHTHPPPLNVHPTASTFRRKPCYICEWQEQTFKHCSCWFKRNFILSYGPACAKNIAGVLHKHTTISHHWRLRHNALTQGKGISQIWQTITCKNLAF